MNVLPTTPAPPAPRPQAAGQKLPRWSDLKRIADAQRLAIFALVGGIVAIPVAAALAVPAAVDERGVGSAVFAIFVLLVVIGVRAWMAVAVYRLARALGSGIAGGILWSIGSFLPNLIGVIVLVVVSYRATTRLKKAGLKVGLLGAKLSETPPPGFLCEEVAGAFS